MKLTSKSPYSPLLILALGLGALLLRLCLFAFGLDGKGLIVPFHPASIGLWLLTAAALVLSLRISEGPSRPIPAAVGCIAMAVGLALSIPSMPRTGFALDTIRDLLGWAAAACLVLLALCRIQGKQPFFLLPTIPCVFFALYPVTRYRFWSGNPQLQEYVFPLLAALLLMLFSYYQAACSAGLDKSKKQLLTGLLSVFFCLAAAAHCESPLLYLTSAVWALTNFSQEARHDPA